MFSLTAFSKKIEAKVTSLLMFFVVSIDPLLSISSCKEDLTSALLIVKPTEPVANAVVEKPSKKTMLKNRFFLLCFLFIIN